MKASSRKPVIVSLIAVFVLTFVLAGCGAGNKESGSAPSASPGASSQAAPSASSGSAGNDSEKKFKLVMNVPNAATSHENQNAFLPWTKLVEEKTNGRITIDLYNANALGSTPKGLFEIGSGVYDVGMVVTNYFVDAGYYPYTVTSLPFAFPDITSAFNVNRKFTAMYRSEEAFKDVIDLGGQFSSDHYILYSKKPVHKVEDIKGMNIIVANQAVAELIAKWGGTPITMSAAETYQAIERGVADATFMSELSGLTFKYQEVAPYYVYLRAWSNPFLMAINRATYESFPDDLKKIFDEELKDFMPSAYTESAKKELLNAKEMIEAQATPIEISDEELKRFMEPVKEAWDNWAVEANKRGYDGDKLLADFIKLLEEEGLKVPWER